MALKAAISKSQEMLLGFATGIIPFTISNCRSYVLLLLSGSKAYSTGCTPHNASACMTYIWQNKGGAD
ncbi:hypothetical protein T10_5114 [Trichinella papuae]|uniref:Uncharacterized protein n=1 Tax=Trichinella papuae TaxID=268474 RepID=A0A0V1MAZ2_9BILA|nr:hypothetical protein T10_5114 [Trichinella papuae]